MAHDNGQTRQLNLSFLFNNWISTVNVVILLLALFFGWAKGFLELPDRISRVEEAQKSLVSLPEKVNTLQDKVNVVEERAAISEKKGQADHDLLVDINATLKQMQRDMENDRLNRGPK